MKQPIISVQSVHKAYGEDSARRQEVLRDVSLEVQEQDFLGLMGSSGSGKTTLLNLIGGLDTADEGTIRVAGKELRALPDAERSGFRLKQIGFIFQFFNLLPTLTVRENIALPLHFLKRPRREVDEAVEAVAEEVGLADKLARKIDQLSGGEMQRVAVARAVVHQPRVLLADEPTGNLDSKTGEAILRLIRNVAGRHGATVLMATHDLEAAAAADRVIHMRDGRIAED